MNSTRLLSTVEEASKYAPNRSFQPSQLKKELKKTTSLKKQKCHRHSSSEIRGFSKEKKLTNFVSARRRANTMAYIDQRGGISPGAETQIISCGLRDTSFHLSSEQSNCVEQQGCRCSCTPSRLISYPCDFFGSGGGSG